MTASKLPTDETRASSLVAFNRMLNDAEINSAEIAAAYQRGAEAMRSQIRHMVEQGSLTEDRDGRHTEARALRIAAIAIGHQSIPEDEQ
jgi:hypothetical protein